MQLQHAASAWWQSDHSCLPSFRARRFCKQVYPSRCSQCQYFSPKAFRNFIIDAWRQSHPFSHSMSFLVFDKSSKDEHGSIKIATICKNISSIHPGHKPLLSRQSNTRIIRKFLFHLEDGGQANATVEKVHKTYVVEMRFSLPNTSSTFKGHTFLHWGLFRSDYSDWVVLAPEAVPCGTIFVDREFQAMQTPMQLEQDGLQRLRIELNADLAPFFICFVLLKSSTLKDSQEWIRSSTHKNLSIPIGLDRGHPEPLGLSFHLNGAANFSLYSKGATNVTLCLYGAVYSKIALEIDLDPIVNRTGDVWHIQLENVDKYDYYGYRCKGDVGWDKGNRFHARNVLLDPYAKVLAPLSSTRESLSIQGTVLGSLRRSSKFDWEDDCHPCIQLKNIVAYRLNVEGFTKDESCGVTADVRGTFLGMTEKIQHLIDLGINAVILQPVFAYDQNKGPFYPFNFFTPMEFDGLSEDATSTSSDFKQMVKKLHKNGIEVILDVVYTHTAENGDEFPQNISFRGIDNAIYYVLDQYGKVATSEYGPNNMFNCNHPVVHKMILDSLRHWVEDYHVDGFCFIDVPSLVTGPHGEALSRPPLIEAISFDPVLAKSKLIADPCSPLTGNYKEFLFPHWKRWSELNSSFFDDVRRFIRGDKGQLSSFATRFCGSGDLFGDGRGPSFSMNPISNHYGMTLADIINFSEEGPTSTPMVLDTQVKKARNFLMVLFLSQGVPVLSMGDEYGHSKVGGHEIGRSFCFQWDALKANYGKEATYLISSLSRFRLKYKKFFQRSKFLAPEELIWHGSEPNSPSWNNYDSCFLAVSLQQLNTKDETVPLVAVLYIAFNAHDYVVNATLPELPQGMIWYQIADTNLPYPDNFLSEGKPIFDNEKLRPFGKYQVQPFSVILLEAVKVEHVSKMKLPSSSVSNIAA